MIYLNLLEDEVLQESLEKIASGLVPHEDYSPEYFVDILYGIHKYIKLNEMSGEYYVLFSLFNQINKIIVTAKSYTPEVSKDVLTTALTANIVDLVRKPEVRMSEIMELEGADSNLAIETNLGHACRILNRRTVELYDRLIDLKTASDSALSYLVALKGSFVSHIAENSINIQARILDEGLKINRRKFVGAEGWLTYIGELYGHLELRLRDEDEQGININSIETSAKLLDKLVDLFQPLAEYGIPPLDNGTPILKHRLVIICANENVGKTKFCVSTAVNVMREGKRVVYMCGETERARTYAQILSNYIYKEFGICITEQMIAKREELPEDKRKLVNIASATLAEQDILRLEKSFNYDTLYADLQKIYNEKAFDAVIIDHSFALRGEGSDYEKVNKLAVDLREFKNDYPVFTLVASHLSALAKDQVIGKGEVESSPTKGSGTLSAEADEIFVLLTNKTLEKENLIALQNYKRRGVARITDLIKLRKKFSVSEFIWDAKIQGMEIDRQLSAEEAIRNLEEQDNWESADDEDDEEYSDL